MSAPKMRKLLSIGKFGSYLHTLFLADPLQRWRGSTGPSSYYRPRAINGNGERGTKEEAP
jgi:hypothetical protein